MSVAETTKKNNTAMDEELSLSLPEDFDDKDRLYYSIGETAKIFDLPVSTLRYWENEFDMLKPRKNKKGDRFFSKNDIALIRTIHYLTKVKGYTLKGAKEAMRNNLPQEGGNAIIIQKLTEIKEMLLKIKRELD